MEWSEVCEGVLCRSLKSEKDGLYQVLKSGEQTNPMYCTVRS